MIEKKGKENSRTVFVAKFWKSILWSVIIAFLLLLPGNKLPESALFNIPYFDKIIHFFLFLFLELLMLIDGKPSGIYRNSRKIMLSVIPVGYAFLTELMQYYLPLLRHGDWYDLLADITGIGGGLFIYEVFS